MKRNLYLRLVACLLLLALCILAGCGDTTLPPVDEDDEPDVSPDSSDPPQESDPEADSLEELLFYLKNVSYFPLSEDFDPTGLSRAELVAATGDRHAKYFTKEEYEAYASDLGGNMVGIGTAITGYAEGDTVVGIHILSVYPGSPAERAGLLVNDIILAVGGSSVSTVGYSAAVNMVAGDKGTDVTLLCRRGTEEISITVTRDSCVKQTVNSRVISYNGQDIGYVYITEFDSVTSLQFVRAVERLELLGVDSFIFDLRNNTGGYLHTVCEMLAYILPDGNICSVDYRYDGLTDYTIYTEGNTLYGIGTGSLSDGTPLDVSHSLAGTPIGVLTDKNTASAAELFTSALRDYAALRLMDVTIFGTTTYGKGSMQSSFQLSNGDHIKMTLALYNPPSGVNYDGEGIDPTEGYAVSKAHTSVVPRFMGVYEDIGTQDPTLSLAITTMAQ